VSGRVNGDRVKQAMPTIKRILCPVDFSDASRHAVDHAIAIARWYNASITAFHVYHPIVTAVPGLPPLDRVPEADLKRVYAETAACFEGASAHGVCVDVIVDVGHPAAQILVRSQAADSDLIVMGTHGASGFEHLLLGSVTEKVLRRALCPVLTVPPQTHATSTLPFKRLLCAVDFSDSSLRGLELACSLAKESDAMLTLLHVIEWPWREPPAPILEDLPSDQAAALAEFRRYVEKSAVERLRGLTTESDRGHCVIEPRVAHGKAYTEILRTAAIERADLIVIGVHGRNAAEVMLFGSTTNQVVRRATCPVLTLRDQPADT
jgi:nucleotide-binding universal stress UspA family protein